MFPPFKKLRYFKANKVLANMADCHVAAAQQIKAKDANAQIGISLNTVVFENESIWTGGISRMYDFLLF